MRYGNVLAQYAVPEWQAFSVDYDEFKALIKNCLVSGIRPDTETAVYSALAEQHERINVFVRSKAGELDRRIRNCNKALDEITKQDAARTYPISNAQRQKPVIKIEAEIESIYQNLQSLARFVSSHKIAFTKLVKTYNKWSHTMSLSTRFAVLVDSPKSFANRDFTSTILELSFLYDSIRRYFQSSLRFFSQPSRTSLTNGDLDFEAAHTLASGSTVFWVHSDNFVELEVLLLKYLSILPNESFFRRNLGQNADYVVESDTRIVYLNSQAVLDNINSRKKLRDEVSRIVADMDVDNAEAVLCTPGGAILSGKKKYIESVVNASASPSEMQQLDSIGKSVVFWLQKYAAKPTATIALKRMRFEQIGSSGPTVWATLDHSVKYKPVVTQTGWMDGCEASAFTTFPYAVLEVRWQGSEPKWLSELKNSHTCYEVPGFSYFAHAVSSLGLSRDQPPWAHLLAEDIHKVPKQKATERPRLRSRTSSAKSTSNAPSTSSSSNATVEGSSSIETPNENWPPTATGAPASPKPAAVAPGTPMDPRAAKAAQAAARAEAVAQAAKTRASKAPRRLTIVHDEARYWNEFDHPEEEDGAFYVDAGESHNLLHKLPIDKLANWSTGFWNRVSKKVHSIHDLDSVPAARRQADDQERESLLANAESELHSPSSSDAHELEANLEQLDSQRHALLGIRIGDTDSVDRALTMFYALSFSMSFMLVIILDGIVFGGQFSAASGLYPSYVSMLASVGIVFAEGIALAGLVAFLWRHHMPGFWHQSAVFVAVLAIVSIGVGGILYIFF
ncbi:hypothetical protein POJ06DRAFT_65524 [Lipomyces tetrasporus]|uniref:SPX domain-containing protein n=1 Tax=Lipomyces tetrasporus TaxID=54092 RepID=A0AAD7QXP6_9ASCO|nr:uncharacterized protein POJ06DRAFT_65524 [Lipomyces tetrasporus]KAJ8103216.1 hypothetical protein POJ06DRAFT_65524 [Lipomyces tetrasporus]